MATEIERYFYPDYVSLDFLTVLNKFKTVLLNTTEFKDINYEGSNVRIYAEMLAYITELNTYYLNRIAKNLYPDTVELYENAHRIAQLIGYAPKGYISSSGEVKVTISQEELVTSGGNPIFEVGDTLYVDLWSSFSTTSSTSFLASKSVQYTILSSDMINPETNKTDTNFVSFTIPIKQGTKSQTYSFTGNDLIDYKLYLPNFNFDHDDDISDDYRSIILMVNGVEWKRVDTFFDPVVLTENDKNIYIFGYDKFQRYYIEFSPFRNYPKNSTDKIEMNLIISLGAEGNIGTNTIVNLNSDCIKNLSKSDPMYPQNPLTISNAFVYSLTNPQATSGGKNPEGLDEIKLNAKSYIYSQARSVTKDDYEFYLNNRSEIVAARSWGERDINPSGDTTKYNKIYFSCIPTNFSTSTISLTSLAIPSSIMSTTETISVASGYNSEWISNLITYLETRKMLCTTELFSLPTLVYFVFDIGVKAKRIYSFDSVVSAIKTKLEYYFQPSNRNFYENINFLDIFNFIMDPTIISSSDSFSAVQGIDSLVFRNIDVIYAIDEGVRNVQGEIVWQIKNSVYEANNTDNKFPQFDKNISNLYPNVTSASLENKMSGIQLGPDQFPILAANLNKFVNEGI